MYTVYICIYIYTYHIFLFFTGGWHMFCAWLLCIISAEFTQIMICRCWWIYCILCVDLHCRYTISEQTSWHHAWGVQSNEVSRLCKLLSFVIAGALGTEVYPVYRCEGEFVIQAEQRSSRGSLDKAMHWCRDKFKFLPRPIWVAGRGLKGIWQKCCKNAQLRTGHIDVVKQSSVRCRFSPS